MTPQRPPKNKAEASCYRYLTSINCTITKRGSPDFFCLSPKGKPFAVEVKKNPRQNIKKSQAKILTALANAGIPAFTYTPQKRLKRWKPNP